MANAREIQYRIKSIKDTMKITNAMYMISSSKLKKAKDALKNTEPYFYTLEDMISRILAVCPDERNKYFDKREYLEKSERKQGYIVVTADKGLAGAYNHNVIKIAENEALSDNDNMLFVVGQVGRNYFLKKNVPVDIAFKYTAQNPNMNRARVISEKMVELFTQKKLDEVYIVYTKMVNSVTVNAEIKKLLPLEEDDIMRKEYEKEIVSFLPNPHKVLNAIVPNYVAGFVYGALIESYCSEHNARMMAMQSATDSAKDMLKDLSIQYNRARQAAITQEITEVISGSKAQKKKGN